MFIKKPRAELTSIIRARVYASVHSRLHILDSASIYDIKNIVANAIVDGVSEGIETLLESLYTDDDFETDIGLKS